MSEAGERSEPRPEGRVAERLSAADKNTAPTRTPCGGRGVSAVGEGKQS